MIGITERQSNHIAVSYYKNWKNWKTAKDRIKAINGENEIGALQDALNLRIYSAKLDAMMEIIKEMYCVVKWDYEIDKPILVDISAFEEESTMLDFEFTKKGLCYEEEEDQ